MVVRCQSGQQRSEKLVAQALGAALSKGGISVLVQCVRASSYASPHPAHSELKSTFKNKGGETTTNIFNISKFQRVYQFLEENTSCPKVQGRKLLVDPLYMIGHLSRGGID